MQYVTAPRRVKGIMLPVARVMLPGPPSKHEHSFSGLMFAIDEESLQNEQYWLDVPRDDVRLKLQQGDLLLMVADEEWKKKPAVLKNRIAIFRDDDDELVLRRIKGYFKAEFDRVVAYCDQMVRVFPAVGKQHAPHCHRGPRLDGWINRRLVRRAELKKLLLLSARRWACQHVSSTSSTSSP